ncbi:MAG: hypothetical protein WCX28_05910 [Bacteriovoracaceae bacterium]|nr:hypothetical protein [Bacteroidota bacterium]
MKKLSVLFVVFFGVSYLFASTPKIDTNESVNWTKAEQNYKANLKSDNNGVITSAANYIRKYKLSGAVEELKPLLKKNNADNVKMSGALALLTIGGAEGRTAVETALETEENELVVEFYRSILHTTLATQLE